MTGLNSLVGGPMAAPPPVVVGSSAGGGADRIIGQGPSGIAPRTADNPPLVLALVILGAVALLAGLNVAGFRSTITVGRA